MANQNLASWRSTIATRRNRLVAAAQKAEAQAQRILADRNLSDEAKQTRVRGLRAAVVDEGLGLLDDLRDVVTGGLPRVRRDMHPQRPTDPAGMIWALRQLDRVLALDTPELAELLTTNDEIRATVLAVAGPVELRELERRIGPALPAPLADLALQPEQLADLEQTRNEALSLALLVGRLEGQHAHGEALDIETGIYGQVADYARRRRDQVERPRTDVEAEVDRHDAEARAASVRAGEAVGRAVGA